MTRMVKGSGRVLNSLNEFRIFILPILVYIYLEIGLACLVISCSRKRKLFVVPLITNNKGAQKKTYTYLL